MAKESKVVELKQKNVYKNECFGWEAVSINNECVLLNRDTDNHYYQTLVENEKKYKELEKEFYKGNAPTVIEKPSFSFWVCFLLTLLCIIPGVVYLIVFIIRMVKYLLNKKKQEQEEYDYSESKKEIKRQMDELLKVSRELFFNPGEGKN